MEYKSNENYQWKPEDKFEVSGLELSLLVNATRDFLNSETSRKVLMLREVYNVLEQKLKKGVEEGVITPVVQEPSVDEEEVKN